MHEKYVLENGIQIVAEKIPYLRSVAIGIWIKAGSVYENSAQNGISHFIEHMLFKGTKKRTAKDIAQTLEAVGGQLNAFTAKECTCLYSRVIDEHLELVVELLSDLILNSIMDEKELEKEKGVILEEISMYEDSPDDVAHELLASGFFQSHPLGQPILGSKDNIIKFTKEDIMEYLDQFYNPHNLVVSIAGNFQDDELIRIIEKYFAKWSKPKREHRIAILGDSGGDVLYKYKDIEQTHVCIGCPGIKLGDENIYPLMVFNNLFGGGMSSRLFQRIREEEGLAYSIFSYPSSYVSGGLFTIYAGMKSSQTEKVVALIRDEIRLVLEGDIGKDEFYGAREQLKGNYILSLESTSNRMTSAGKNQLLIGRILPPREVLSKINKVELDDIYGVLEKVFVPNHMTTAFVSREDLTHVLQNIF